MRMQVWSLALLSGLRRWHCLKLWCRSQTQLRTGVSVAAAAAVAVAVAGSCSSDSTASLGTYICHGCRPTKTKKQTNPTWTLELCYQESKNYEKLGEGPGTDPSLGTSERHVPANTLISDFSLTELRQCRFLKCNDHNNPISQDLHPITQAHPPEAEFP